MDIAIVRRDQKKKQRNKGGTGVHNFKRREAATRSIRCDLQKAAERIKEYTDGGYGKISLPGALASEREGSERYAYKQRNCHDNN